MLSFGLFCFRGGNMEIGNRIKELRIAKGMTQKDLADLFFVTPQAVSRWESNDTEPSVEMIGKLAEHFGVSIDYLFGLEVEQGYPEKVETTEQPKKMETEREPVLAVCEKCNRPIYKPDEIVRRSHRYGRKHYKTKLLCIECHKKNEKAIHDANVARAKSNRIRSFWIAGVVSAIVLAITLYLTIPTGEPNYILLGIASAIGSFTFVGCLCLKNNFIGEMVLEIFSWGFVKFPGVIFSLDLGGIIWLLTVKLLFWILGILLAIATLMFGLGLGLILSIIVYPFALRKSIVKPAEINI